MDKSLYGLNIETEEFNCLDLREVEEYDRNSSNNINVLVITDNRESMSRYYQAVKSLAIGPDRLIVLIEKKLVDEYKSIISIMNYYKLYDIYIIENIEDITEKYLEELINRKPSNNEILSYLDNNYIQYENVCDVLIKIRETVEEGNLEKLEGIIKSNADTVINGVNLIEYLKTELDKLLIESSLNISSSVYNSSKEIKETIEKSLDYEDNNKNIINYQNKIQELENKLLESLEKDNIIMELKNIVEDLREQKEKLERDNDNLKEKVETDLKEKENKLEESQKNNAEYKSKINELQDTIEKLYTGKENNTEKDKNEQELKKYEEHVESLKEEMDMYKKRVVELEETINKGGPILHTYKEINVANIKCKISSILYFKEITYVRYANSLIYMMGNILSQVHKLKVKTIIYDNRTGFLKIYDPIPIIGTSEYLSNREMVVNKTEKIVVVEPNPSIIDDILKIDYDVLIILDRMRNGTDILKGNNVFKYWIINSSEDIRTVNATLNNNLDLRHVITSEGLDKGSIAIPNTIDYKDKSEGARMSTYIKAINANSENGKDKLIDTFFKRANIQNLIERKF